MFYSCIATKVKAKADAGDIDRTEAPRISLSPEKSALNTAIMQGMELHTFSLKGALQHTQLEPPAQELYQWHP